MPSIPGIAVNELSNPLRSLVSGELDRDEKIVWLDQPKPWSFVRRYVPFMLFGVVGLCFSIFWMASAFSMANGRQEKEGEAAAADHDFIAQVFPLFGVPFLMVGLGATASPLYGRWQAKRSAYAITDKRALIFQQQLSGISIRSYGPEQLESVERKQRSDGSGDLVFERLVGNGENRSYESVGFLGVDNVKRVGELIDELAEREPT